MTAVITPSPIVEGRAPLRLAGSVEPGTRFADALREASAPDDDAGRGSELRAAATELVSSALLLPVFQSLREGPFSDGPFAPGPAERRFMPLLDQQLADRVVSAARFDLVDVIVERFAAPSEKGEQHRDPS